LDGNKLVNVLRKKYGVTVAGGQGKLKGKIIRIGHLGYADYSDLYVVFGSMERVLYDFGYRFEIGISLKALQKALIKE
jgi:aspartate aminotransferase-like enzyme